MNSTIYEAWDAAKVVTRILEDNPNPDLDAIASTFNGLFRHIFGEVLVMQQHIGQMVTEKAFARNDTSIILDITTTL